MNVNKNENREMNNDTGPLKIIQVNAGKSKDAMDEIRKYMDEEKIAIALIQEPATHGNSTKIHGLGTGVRIIKAELEEGERVKAIIVIADDNMDVLAIKKGTRKDTATAIIRRADKEIILISAYMNARGNVNIKDNLDNIKEIIRHYDGWEIIIGTDANAKNQEQWFSKVTDERGTKLLDFVLENHLNIHNEPGHPNTYRGHRGPEFNQNIDVTITTRNITKVLKNWKVTADIPSADHRMIQFEVKGIKRGGALHYIKNINKTVHNK